MTENLIRLAQYMKHRRTQNEPPYILVLGAGASLSSGCQSTEGIVDGVLKQLGAWSNELEGDSFEVKYGIFSNLLDGMSNEERYVILKPYLEVLKPSEGYNYLAKMASKGYFRVVLSTNFDRLFELSLRHADTSLEFERLIVGRDNEEFIRNSVQKYNNIPVVLIKLHGDLLSRMFAFTNAEILEFSTTVSSIIEELLKGDMIIVGNSLRDLDILRCMHVKGGSIWYVNPKPPEGQISGFITSRRSNHNCIIGELGEFDNFFEQLWLTLESRNIENFLEAFGLGNEVKNLNSYYLNLPSLYVEPSQLKSEILPILRREHIVFIIGDPHIGKTYSALMVLWLSFKEGFNPVWVTTSQLERLFVSGPGAFNKFCEIYLKEKNCVYIEDPFGRTDQLKIHDFIANIHNLIIGAKQKNVRIVITSRTAQFDTVLSVGSKEHTVILRQFMKLGESYSEIDLKTILLRYCNLYNPSWFKKEELRNYVLDKVKDLGAPHNIEIFVRSSNDAGSVIELEQILENSKDILSEIAGEFQKQLLEEKILLFSLTYFSKYYSDETKTIEVFDKICSSLGVFKQWELVAVGVGRYLGTSNSGYYLRHPSYEEAFIKLVKHDPETTLIVRKAFEVLRNIMDPWIKEALVSCLLKLGLNYIDRTNMVSIIRDFLEDESVTIRERAITACIQNYKTASPECKKFILQCVIETWNIKNICRFFCINYLFLNNENTKSLVDIITQSDDSWAKLKLIQWCNLPIISQSLRARIADILSKDNIGEVVRLSVQILNSF